MIHAELWSAGKFDDAYFDTPEEVVEWAKGRSWIDRWADRDR